MLTASVRFGGKDNSGVLRFLKYLGMSITSESLSAHGDLPHVMIMWAGKSVPSNLFSRACYYHFIEVDIYINILITSYGSTSRRLIAFKSRLL